MNSCCRMISGLSFFSIDYNTANCLQVVIVPLEPVRPLVERWVAFGLQITFKNSWLNVDLINFVSL